MGGARQLTKTDRNGRLAGLATGLANWGGSAKNRPARRVLEGVAGVHREAVLPKFHGKTFVMRAKADAPALNREAPAFGRKAVLYATCFVNYNNPDLGILARRILAKNGVETEVVHPHCCGMPQLEQGDIAGVARNAAIVAGALVPWVERGYDVIALVPSCALMLKFEWPLIVPDDAQVKRLSGATRDISEYLVGIARNEGLAPGLGPLPGGGVTLHLACHARAQNMGQKGGDLLRLIPDTDVDVIERCSGHGGSWGIMKENFETALKIGKPVFDKALKTAKAHVVSECPLAGDHIHQGMARLAGDAGAAPPEGGRSVVAHPIELFAAAYGFS